MMVACMHACVHTSRPSARYTGRMGCAAESWFTAMTSGLVRVASEAASMPPHAAPGRRSAERISGPGRAAHIVNLEIKDWGGGAGAGGGGEGDQSRYRGAGTELKSKASIAWQEKCGLSTGT